MRHNAPNNRCTVVIGNDNRRQTSDNAMGSSAAATTSNTRKARAKYSPRSFPSRSLRDTLVPTVTRSTDPVSMSHLHTRPGNAHTPSVGNKSLFLKPVFLFE
ncbi:hypothetical protein GCM10022243_13700 [Saccharothrix violaceirubra]